MAFLLSDQKITLQSVPAQSSRDSDLHTGDGDEFKEDHWKKQEQHAKTE